jgi:dihydroorotase-like cyclic amidohydrolase
VTYDLVLRSGLLLGSTTEKFADIRACGEQIAAIRLDLDGPHQIDATGLCILQGVIDGLVQLTDVSSSLVPPAASFLTGTCAASTTPVDLAGSRPDEPLRESLRARTVCRARL